MKIKLVGNNTLLGVKSIALSEREILVAVMARFVRAVDGDVNVGGLIR